MRIMAHELRREAPPRIGGYEYWLNVAKENGISENTFWQRVNRLGQTDEEAATRPLHERRKETITTLAERYGVTRGAIYSWRHRHPEQRDRPLEEIVQVIVRKRQQVAK